MDAPDLDALVAERDRLLRERRRNTAQRAVEGDNHRLLSRHALGALAAGDRDLARRLLERAEASATTRLASFSAWAQSHDPSVVVPDSPVTSRVLLEARTRRELAAIREDQMALISASGRRALIARAGEIDDGAALDMIVDLAEGAVADRLARGDLEGARELAAQFIERELADPVRSGAVRDADAGSLERLARIVRAHRVLGEPLHHGVLVRIGRTGQEAIDELCAPRTASRGAPAGTPATTNGRFGFGEAHTAEAWQAMARAVAFHPAAMSVNEPQIASGDAFASWIPATLELFCALAPSFIADTAFIGPALLRAPHPRRADTALVWAALRLGAVVEGREHQPAMIVAIGDTRAATDSGVRRKAAGLWRSLGLGEQAQRVPVINWNRQHLTRCEQAGDMAPRPASALYGPDRCEHPQGRWCPNRTGDALVLRCGSCRRPQIAVVPFHRLPAGNSHHLSRANPRKQDEYLRREEFYRRLAGDPRPVTATPELIAEEPPMSLDPADYAIVPEAAERPGAGFASAFTRRRSGEATWAQREAAARTRA